MGPPMSIDAAKKSALPFKTFRPPAPKPREKLMSSLEMLYVVSRNPLEVWNRIHFEQKSVARRNIMGEVVVLMDPAAIRHVMVDNAANYRKDDLQRRVLGADRGKGESLLTAEGELWRQTRRTVAPLFTPRRIAGFLPLMLEAAEKLAARLAAEARHLSDRCRGRDDPRDLRRPLRDAVLERRRQ